MKQPANLKDFIFIAFMSDPIEQKKVFVILPVYNEHRMLRSVVHELLQKPYSIVVVDDGSESGLKEALSGKTVFYLRHDINLGQGAALQTGIEFALSKGAEYIVTFDGDGQHHADDIDHLLQTLIHTKVDVVLGSRFIKDNQKIPMKRKQLLHLARYFNYLFTGLLLTDAHNGLRVFSKNAAQQIQITENRMAHATEILSLIKKRNLKYAEAPVTISYTDYSRKKGQTVWGSFRIFFDLLLSKIFK